MIDIPLLIEFTAPSSVYRERDLAWSVGAGHRVCLESSL
jgi:hypothetical protein